MIEEKLEIVLITYNRDKFLENTFKQFIDSPFFRCKITVLDNCSTDKTSELCANYQKIFPNMQIKKHKRNIGGNPNILRAVETSNSIYTWIIGDDDSYNFCDCNDVIEAIEDENVDLISLGSPGQYDWERGMNTASNELIKKGSKYFHVFTFVSGFIFKTELFDSNCVHEGYYNAHNLYPHFPFIVKSVEKNFTIYISNEEIIVRGIENTSGFSGLFWLKSWLKSCSKIKDKKIRRKTIYESPFKQSFLKRVIVSIIMDKVSKKDNEDLIEFISAFVYAFGWSWDSFLLIIIIPVVIIPSFIYKILVRSYRYFKYDILKREVPKSIKDQDSDKFRT
jgi:glycosyltransferase involved in cell wall biosynthesis